MQILGGSVPLASARLDLLDSAQVYNQKSVIIGIKYGPEGRVANKAEELMSTRSRRKAPRTG